MPSYSKKPLIVPISMTIIVASIAAFVFISAQQVRIELPSHPEIHPKLLRDGSSFSGFIDIIIPINISNSSPASLKNGRIFASMSIISIENYGLFPDTTIMNISEEINTIKPHNFVQIEIHINVSSWVPILAVMDAYLVLDIDISLNYQLGLFNFPVHLIGRIQDTWEAPFSIY